MSHGGSLVRSLRLTPKGLAAVTGWHRPVATDATARYDRLVDFGFAPSQAYALTSAGYGFIGGAL